MINCLQCLGKTTREQQVKQAVLTCPLQLVLPGDADGCHPPEAGWMPASMTQPQGPNAAAAPATRHQAAVS